MRGGLFVRSYREVRLGKIGKRGGGEMGCGVVCVGLV